MSQYLNQAANSAKDTLAANASFLGGIATGIVILVTGNEIYNKYQKASTEVNTKISKARKRRNRRNRKKKNDNSNDNDTSVPVAVPNVIAAAVANSDDQPSTTSLIVYNDTAEQKMIEAGSDEETSTKEEAEVTTTKVEEEALATEEIVDDDNQSSTTSVHMVVEETVNEDIKAEKKASTETAPNDDNQSSTTSVHTVVEETEDEDNKAEKKESTDTSVSVAPTVADVVPSSPILPGFTKETRRKKVEKPFGIQGCLIKNIKLCNTDRARAGDGAPFFFNCDAVCVIDFTVMFHVIPVVRATGEALEDWMETMFRFEGKPNKTQIDYSKRLDKKQCMALMMEYLDRVPRCMIRGLPFPYFDQDGNHVGGRKWRPCVVLCGAEGDDDVAELYLAIFIGQETHKYSGEFELESDVVHNLPLGEDGDLVPKQFQHKDGTMRDNPKPYNILDCTKLSGLPYHHSHSGLPLAAPYLVGGDNGADRLIEANYLKAVDSGKLRTKIVDSLKKALWDNPITDYKDTTKKYDIGQYVDYYRVRETDGETMSYSVRINGPPGYSSPSPPPLTTNLSLATPADHQTVNSTMPTNTTTLANQTVSPNTPTNTGRAASNTITP